MKLNHLFAGCLFLLVGSACESELDNKTAAEVAPAAAPADKAPADKASADKPAGDEAPAGSLKLASSSTIEWVGAKVTGDHSGGFKVMTGHAMVADGSLKTAKVQIDMSSLDSDHPKLTKHLLSEDFFDVSKFATATFEITEVAPGEDGMSKVTGDLDLHGMKKSISFPATVKTTDTGASVTAEFTLMRKDFGITYPGKPEDLIRDEVLVKGTLSFGS